MPSSVVTSIIMVERVPGTSTVASAIGLALENQGLDSLISVTFTSLSRSELAGVLRVIPDAERRVEESGLVSPGPGSVGEARVWWALWGLNQVHDDDGLAVHPRDDGGFVVHPRDDSGLAAQLQEDGVWWFITRWSGVHSRRGFCHLMVGTSREHERSICGTRLP